MNWKNIKFIFQREIIDQLRDRRTLFTILVLPLILYPLLGTVLLQTAQFMHKTPATVWVVGADRLPQAIKLIEGDRFVEGLADVATLKALQVETNQEMSQNIEQTILKRWTRHESNNADEFKLSNLDVELKRWIQEKMNLHHIDVLLWVPMDFRQAGDSIMGSEPTISNFQIIVNSARDKSPLAGADVHRILGNWRAQLIEANFTERKLSFNLAFPFAIEAVDVVEGSLKQVAVWAKILPFVVMLWALTGAFYPAIDLCAGEKERGTLETLLSSPAARSEIVLGKWMTIMVFSVSNAVLNLFSMTLTGLLVLKNLSGAAPVGVISQIGLPPVSAIPWIVIGLLPVAAMFSALALALASFARSSKEGQYYLIPLLMALLPLMMLSIMPSTSLDLGTSFIPVTGMMLLLRNMIEGNHGLVLQFACPVLATTIACCWLSVRWAVSQFNNENVLFRSSDQFGVTIWFKQVMRDRGMKPAIGHAVLCFITILIVKFFLGLAVTMPGSWGEFAKQILIIQIAAIAVPAILMAAILTRCAKDTLRLKTARPGIMAASVLLAIMLYPSLAFVGKLVMHVYPPSAELQLLELSLGAIIDSAPGIIAVLVVFALVPAVCEELAFRGFMLSGLESLRGRWSAVLLTSLFFGATHAVFQQSIMAFIIGVVLGVIALRTGSILPCILFHLTHNGMTVVMSRVRGLASSDSPFRWFLQEVESDGRVYVEFQPIAIVGMAILATLLLAWIWKQKPRQDLTHSDRSPQFPEELLISTHSR